MMTKGKSLPPKSVAAPLPKLRREKTENSGGAGSGSVGKKQ